MNFEQGPQEYTSKDTAQNRWKIPQLFNKVQFKPNTTCLDYGGGPWDTVTDFLKEKGVTAQVYDCYNRSAEHNQMVLQWVEENGGVDYVTCSNVLNVIAELDVQRNVLSNIWKSAKKGATIWFITYEGDRSGIGKRTKIDCYQNNKRTKEYLPLIREFFPDAKICGFLITAHKE